MKKKLIAGMTSAALIASLAVPAFAASNFTDIDGSYAKAAIEQLVAKGIINGVDATHFNPDGSLTRAQFAKIVAGALGLDTSATVSSFSDVSGWAVGYVEAAKKAGLIDGVGNGQYDPNGIVNREQAAKILVNALKTKMDLDMTADLSFPDKDQVSDWAKSFVAVAAKYGLIKGNDDGTFNPKGNATRAQAAVLAQRLLTEIETAAYAITPATANLAVGQSQQFTVAGAKNVVWSVSGNGVIDQNGNFVGSAAGSATITAVADGKTLTANVTVYGVASAVKLSAISDIVANNKSMQTVTATVVDANGNPVSNFNGTVDVSVTTTDYAVKLVGGSTTDYSNAATSLTGVKVTNGTATFQIVSGSVAGMTDKVQVSNLKDANSNAVSGYQAVTGSVNTIAQVATAITAKPASNYIEVNDNNGQVAFSVNVNDQTGNPMLGGTYVLTAAVAGGGQFTDATTSGKTVVVSGGAAQNVNVKGVQGVTGTYTFTVTGTNLTTATATVSAVVAGNAAKLAIANSTPSFTQGDAGTTFTLSATDVNGAPVAYPNTVTPKVYITDANGKAVTFFTVSDSVYGAATLDTTDNGYSLPANSQSIVVKDISTGAHAGTYNIVVKDVQTSNTLAATASTTFTEKAGTTATAITVKADKTVLVGPNTTTTITVQATDSYGNAIAAAANQPVTLAASRTNGSGSASFNGAAVSTTPSVNLTLDGTGKATAIFNAQDYDGAAWSIQASGLGTPVSTSVYVTDHAAASYSFKLADQTTGNTTFATAGDSVNVAGSVYQLVAAALDANGNAVSTGNDSVTLVIGHASGLSGLPTAPTNVNYSSNTTNDTVTYTGKLADVSSAIYGASLKAAKAGTVSFNLTDNVTNATGAAAIQVVASTVYSSAAPVSIVDFSSATTVAKSSTKLFTVQLVDAGGNPVYATQDVTVNLSTSISGATFQDVNHLPVASVTIKAGTSSAQAYLATSATTGTGTVTATVSGATAVTSATITVQ